MLVIPRNLNFICQRFGTFCGFHLHMRVVILHTYLPMKMEQTECSQNSARKIQTTTTTTITTTNITTPITAITTTTTIVDGTPVGARSSTPVHTGPVAHPPSYTMGTASSFRWYSGRRVALTTHHI